MIASLSGVLGRATPAEVVVEVGGVGYRVRIPLTTYASLPAAGERVRLRVVTVVREDEISLYGFATEQEEELFGLMQQVSGVGPKLALKILSGMPAASLLEALAGGNLPVLTAVPGVGRKTAERLVLELRDKALPLLGGAGGAARAAAPGDDAVEALVGLGYPAAVAQKAVEAARGAGEQTLPDVIRQALRSLAPKGRRS